MITTKASLVQKYDSPSQRVSYLIFQVEDVFSFSEGQFVMLETEVQGKILKNPYSIASTNKQLQNEKHLGIVVKKTSDHGMSNRMTQDIQLGDTVSIKGPVGHYTDTQEHQRYLFVSVGSGLSPNLGLFQHLAYETKSPSTIVNIFGERRHKHIIPHVHDLFTQHGKKDIHNMFYLSQETNMPIGYTKGYVQDGLQQAISLLGTKTNCFLCGKPEMVEDVKEKLLQFGIEKQDITFEKY